MLFPYCGFLNSWLKRHLSGKGSFEAEGLPIRGLLELTVMLGKERESPLIKSLSAYSWHAKPQNLDGATSTAPPTRL